MKRTILPVTGVNAATQTALDAVLGGLSTDLSTLPRLLAVANNVPMTTQVMRLGYFTASRSGTFAGARVVTGSTAAAATPTLCKVGLFSVAGNGDLTRVAATASDTTLFAAGGTVYNPAFSASASVAAGSVYALAVLVVSSATMPTFWGSASFIGSEFARAPRLSGLVTGQTDIPASVSAGSVTTSGAVFYGALTP